jgi:polyribonucleotide nucleotidyltransferase
VQVKQACKQFEARTMRGLILERGLRPDGRRLDEVRSIASRCSVLPRAHGSALFTRGETQALCTVTLGDQTALQYNESLAQGHKASAETFYLQYFFPPSSVGETGRMGVAGRREVGHGKLAERSLAPAVEELEDWTYVTRVESHVTESNGSSSMASVCGGYLALLVRHPPCCTPLFAHVLFARATKV